MLGPWRIRMLGSFDPSLGSREIERFAAKKQAGLDLRLAAEQKHGAIFRDLSARAEQWLSASESRLQLSRHE